MKEEFFEKFANKAMTYLENTEVFLKDQIPDYFQQVVSYYAIQSWTYVAFSLILLIFAIFFFRIGFVNCKKKNASYDPETWMPQFFIGIFALILFIGVFSKNFPTALKATIAPKVFVVDYLRGKE